MESRHRLGRADVSIEDDFWTPWIETNRTTTLDYQYDQMAQRGVFENFRRVGDGLTGGHQGHWFADEHAYKWLEAASYVLAKHDDSDLRARIDEVVELIADAQAEDGYLHTYVTLEEPDERWSNLSMMTELYCAGHLFEAAVAHYEATGERTLLEVATRLADHVDATFGEEFDGVPGHPEVELALGRLAEATGEDRYRELAAYFVNRRGHDDRLRWEFEHPEEIGGHEYHEQSLVEMGRQFYYVDGEYDGGYAQDQAPLREQETVEGHAVRVGYLGAGATDVAADTDDEELLDHLEYLWEQMTTKRAYVTGGIGSTDGSEGFTEDYDLPNESAYAETCAAIGSIFWSQRLFEQTGKVRYADLIERTLYNAVLPGVSLDGTAFFYDNVLEADAEHTRQEWYECACCPPNLSRLLASLEQYLYAVDDEGLYVNQYVSGTASATVAGTEVELTQSTAYPWEETVEIAVQAAEPTEFALRLRVPEWCDDATVAVDGEPIEVEESGYLAIERTWDDQTVTATFEQSVRVLEAHPAVEADAHCLAIARGPLVYCLEGVDNDRPLHQYAIDPDADFDATYREDRLGGVVTLDGEATVPATDGWEDSLYRRATETDRERTTITAVPYYAWANREPGEMRVWLHRN